MVPKIVIPENANAKLSICIMLSTWLIPKKVAGVFQEAQTKPKEINKPTSVIGSKAFLALNKPA